ncbi:MAG: tetratricopeptide repeat protein [Leptolyngbyaceae cyanobacterium SL_5_14]|nr:tetratricopeptide repeat protein [Leptolyngbyaceae cyanobacterium SL_5_14]
MRAGFKFLLLLSGFCCISVVCAISFYAVVKAQEQQGCFMIDEQGSTTDLSRLCGTRLYERGAMEDQTAENIYQEARQLGKQGQYELAVARYTQAIELNPNMVEAYAFRGITLSMIPGQEQRGIEDTQKAAEILRSQGREEEAKWADEQVRTIQGIISERAEERRLGIEVE